MNKKILAVVVVAILIGVTGFILLKPNKTTVAPVQQNAPEVKTEQSPQPKSLKDLLSVKVSQECTFTDGKGNSGTVFVSNGKVRSDFTTEAEGKQIKSHTIVDGQTVYFWMEGQTNGYKMPLNTASDKPVASSQASQTQEQVDIDKKVDYNCKNWIVNSAVFNIPTEIKFSDFGALVTPNQCAACESLTGEAKTQCKTALKCS